MPVEGPACHPASMGQDTGSRLPGASQDCSAAARTQYSFDASQLHQQQQANGGASAGYPAKKQQLQPPPKQQALAGQDAIAFAKAVQSLSALNVNAPAFTPAQPAQQAATDFHLNGAVHGHAPANGHRGDRAAAHQDAADAATAQPGWGVAGFDGEQAQQYGWGKGEEAYPGYGYGDWTLGYGGMEGGYIPPQMEAAWAMQQAQLAAQGYLPRPQGTTPRVGGRQSGPEAAAALAVLQQQFPLYSKDSLTDVLKVNNFDLVGALDMLAQLESEQSAGSQRRQQQQAPPKLDNANFPSLATASPATSPRPAQQDGAGQDGAAANGHAAGGDASSSGGSSAGEAAGGEVASAWGSRASVASAVAAQQAESGQLASPTPKQALQQQQQQRARDGRRTSSSKQKVSVPWVETGAAVAGQYHEAREVAKDHARLRNMYFQQATQAYLAGNKAAAKELGAKGRQHSEQMKQAHASASETIFQQRNARSQASPVFNKNGTIMLDLHGLHVSEAIKILSRELSQLQDSGRRVPVKVHVLTGTGHHTKGSRTPARLPVAVETFLQGEGVKFSRPQPGLLQIML